MNINMDGSGVEPLIYPQKPRPGDQVAVLSPSSGLPGLLPLPFELGVRRLKDEFGLQPVEYSTTRRMGSTAADRAADLHSAFTDPSIKAVIASIGGDDQITVLPYLDPEVFRTHPKPFFRFSDNTNLLAFLYEAGIVSFHGGHVMMQFGRPGALHPVTAASLRAALFDSGPHVLRPPEAYGDVDAPWGDAATFAAEPVMEPAGPWSWHQADQVVSGVGWGGNIEILSWLLMANRCIPLPESLSGGVLFLETSEELPSSAEVYRTLRSMGERGLLGPLAAILFGRAKAWSFARPSAVDEKAAYRQAQHDAILKAAAEYAPRAMVVLDGDFGHTDPQFVLPMGGTITVDGLNRRISAHY